jgi:hypothetical protein
MVQDRLRSQKVLLTCSLIRQQEILQKQQQLVFEIRSFKEVGIARLIKNVLVDLSELPTMNRGRCYKSLGT